MRADTAEKNESRGTSPKVKMSLRLRLCVLRSLPEFNPHHGIISLLVNIEL